MNNKEVSIRGIPFNKTILCQYLKDEGKCMNQTCKYAHSDEEKNNAIAYYKDQTCIGWLKSKCKFGKKCMLLHGFKNLEAGAKIDCTFIRNIILIRKFPVSFDVFENGNIMMKLNNIGAGFTIVNENGKELLDINPIKNTLYDKFKTYNNNNFICSSDKILMISKLPKIDETNHNIMTKFSGRKKNIDFSDISYKIKNDIFKICPNGNILLLNGRYMEILNGQNLSLIKQCNIPSNIIMDISQYAFFISDNNIYVSTSFNKIYRYNYNLEELNSIDNHFKDNTIIQSKDKIIILDYDNKDEVYQGSYTLNIYSSNLEPIKTVNLEYKAEKIYEIPNKSYFIGLTRSTLIFYSIENFNILGYCHLHDSPKNVIIKNEKLYVLFNEGKLELYKINEH